MALYTKESVERVRDAVDMVDLVSTRSELRRAGAGRYTGLCPFHEERSPSFSVDAGQKLYHCFGCGVGGDAISFVREIESLDFKSAIEWLASRYAVELELEDEDPREAERRMRRERLLELLERASRFYVRHLWESDEGEAARRYLAERGLEEATLREFRVGYAPSGTATLGSIAARQGFSQQDLYATGLIRRRDDGQVRDFFWSRIVFPLCDARGRVLGFGARGLREDQKPKYVNTPDGDVYRKGRHLFGADVARVHATRSQTAVVCEGYTDVLMLHQSGVRNAVGIMGTSLTEDQVGELGRLATKVLLALDADSAGQEAMLRAAKVAAGRRLEMRVVPLPEGRDPADIVLADGPAAAQALVDSSIPFVRFRTERELRRGDLTTAEGKDAVIEALKPVFAALPPSALREELLALVAERTGLASGLVTQWLPEPGTERPASGGSGPPPPPPPPPRVRQAPDQPAQAERAFLLACLAAAGEGSRALAEVDDEAFSDPALRRAAAHLRVHLREPGEGLPEDDAQFVALIAGLVAAAGRIETPTAQAVRGQLAHLQIAALDRRIAEARSARAGGVADLRRRRDELVASYNASMRDQMAATKAPDD